jgi:uncharacterized membrane protein YkvA (DUF1232 family)
MRQRDVGRRIVYDDVMRSWLALLWTLLSRIRLTWRLLREPGVAILAKLLPLLAVLYVIFPLDFVPDLIPVLGQLDDLGVIVLAMEAFVHLCPQDAVAFHKDAISFSRKYTPMLRPEGTGRVIDAEFRRDDEV